MRLALLVLTSLVVACGSHAAKQTATTHVERPAPTAPGATTPAEIRELAASVERASAEPAALGSALSRLGDVVQATDPEAGREIARLATELAQSRADARTADRVQRALATALDALAANLPSQPSAPVQRAYVLARRATARLSADEPLSGQSADVTAALRSMTNLAALAQNAPPPFAEEPGELELGYDPDELRTRANLASAAVADLARESDWQRGGRRTAHALDTLANVLEVAPLSATPAAWRSLVLAVRFEAIELARQGAITLERSDRVKAGLASCVDALEQIAKDHREEPFRTMVANARSAVDAIDGNRSWVFQRGILQEAFRTTADAFLVVARPRAESPTASARR